MKKELIAGFGLVLLLAGCAKSTHNPRLLERQLVILEQSSDPKARKQAVFAVIEGVAPIKGPGELAESDFQKDEVIRRLSLIFKNEADAEVQRELARLAGEIKEPRLASPLEAMLKTTGSESARMEIIRTLSILHDPVVMPYLEKYFRSTDKEAINLAIFGFSLFENAKTTGFLIKALEHHGDHLGMYYAAEALQKRGAKAAVPALKRVVARKVNDYDLHPALRALLNLDPTYAELALTNGDEFDLKAISNVLAIASTNGWSIARIQGIAMDRSQPTGVRRNALISLRLGYYWNPNYRAYLDTSERAFFDFLKTAKTNPHENGLVQEECSKILSMKG